MDFTTILQAGIASVTVLLFATIGELFSERAGVFYLGVEGMMLIGAMSDLVQPSQRATRGLVCWWLCSLRDLSARSMLSL
jgi:ABC-type uncharacterized transport system permease subunit